MKEIGNIIRWWSDKAVIILTGINIDERLPDFLQEFGHTKVFCDRYVSLERA